MIYRILFKTFSLSNHFGNGALHKIFFWNPQTSYHKRVTKENRSLCGSPFIVFKNSISFVLNLLKLGQHQNFWSNIVESICKKGNLFFNWLFGKDEILPRMYSWFYWSQFSCPAIILVPDLFSWSSRNSFKLCPTGLLLNRTNLVWGG